MWPWEITIWGESENCRRAKAAIHDLQTIEELRLYGPAICKRHAMLASRETLWVVAWSLLMVHASVAYCLWVIER